MAQSQSLAETQKLDAFTCQFIPVFLQEALGCPKNGEGRLTTAYNLYNKPFVFTNICSTILWTMGWGLKAYIRNIQLYHIFLSFAAEVAQSQSLAEAQKLDAFTCQFIPVFLQEALGCPKNGEGRLTNSILSAYTINPSRWVLPYIAAIPPKNCVGFETGSYEIWSTS